MSAFEPVGLGAGAGAVGWGAGAGAGAAGWEAWWRRPRFFLFFFFGVFGFTGALGGRTVDGEMPPVAWLVAVGVLVPGAMPPEVDEVVDPAEGALTPPVVAAEAVLAPHERARRSTAAASVERMRLAPCMGLCFERASTLLALGATELAG